MPSVHSGARPTRRDRSSFGLTRDQAGAELTFIHASDTHISPASLARTQRLRALVDSINPGLLLITGDLVRDALRVPEAEAIGYYELFMKERGAFRTPVFTVPGNHENFGIERDSSHVPATHPLYGRAMYHHYLGPDYYSFTRGGVHFVGLNTVDIDDQQYYGHVDSLQLAWLERDLALVPATTPIVTFDHIPFFTTFEVLNGYNDRPPAPSLITVRGKTVYRHSVSNAGDVLAVLRKHRHVLALGGHMHATERIEYEMSGVTTRFNQVSAVVGNSRGAGLESISGVTLYRVKNGAIDAGRFIPAHATHPARSREVIESVPVQPSYSVAAGARRRRERGGRQNVVQAHVVRDLAVVIRHVERVAQDHAGARALPRLPAERQRDLFAQFRIVELGERVLAELERRLELRDERVLGPLRLDGVGRRRIRCRQRRLHLPEIIAEEIVVARQMLRDVAQR